MNQHPPFYLYHLDRRRNALMLSRLMRRWQSFLASPKLQGEKS